MGTWVRIKDFVIASGLEPWLRPIWMKLTGKKLSEHDGQLFQLVKDHLKPESVCIDVGCHKGLILDVMVRNCPRGRFFAFEPIPYNFALLQRKYRNNPRVKVFDVAAYSENGQATFHVDVRAPGLSGLRRRTISGSTQETREIRVKTGKLDDLLLGIRPDFIKIDVEGAEFHVLARIMQRFDGYGALGAALV